MEATFGLDPVVNIPGPSAMPIPVGLGPCHIRGMATTRQTSGRKFAQVCMSGRHREEVELRLPANARIKRIPSGVSFVRGPRRCVSTYRQADNVVLITREVSADRRSHTRASGDPQQPLHRRLRCPAMTENASVPSLLVGATPPNRGWPR